MKYKAKLKKYLYAKAAMIYKKTQIVYADKDVIQSFLKQIDEATAKKIVKSMRRIYIEHPLLPLSDITACPWCHLYLIKNSSCSGCTYAKKYNICSFAGSQYKKIIKAGGQFKHTGLTNILDYDKILKEAGIIDE